MGERLNKHNNVVSLFPIKKSKTAFLIEGLDRLDSTDKPYHVEEWDLSTSHTVGVRYNLTVSFRSTNSEHVRGVQDVLYKLYHHTKNDNILSVAQMDGIKTALQHIADCLDNTDWGDLNNRRNWISFLRKLKHKNLGTSSLNQVLSALNKLTDVGELKSYVDAKEVRKCSSGKETKQHVAIPHNMYQCMMNYALSVVEKYHSYRHDISKVMGEAYDIQKRVTAGEKIFIEGMGSGRKLGMNPEAIKQRVTRGIKVINHDIPDFNVDLRACNLADILTCCLIVVQGFSGVRVGEAVSFNKNSTKPKRVNGKPVIILTGATTKGNDGKPKVVTWQSHPVVKTALELAYDMMESVRTNYHECIDKKENQGETAKMIQHMRKQLESAFLVPKITQQNGNNYIFDPFKALKRFMRNLAYKATLEDVEEFNMLNPTREGELKVGGTYDGLNSHDFRRTFAVFFVRYGFGTASGIKFQFKHKNINMSGYYANNAVLAQMNDLLLDDDILDDLKEAGIDLGIDIYDEIYNTSKNLSGSASEDIIAQRMEMLKVGDSIIMTRAEIEENIRRGNFHVTQLPSGAYCTNGSCDRVCGTLTFRAEIKECKYKIVTDKGAKMVAKQRDRLIAKFVNINTGDPLKRSILSGLKQKIQVEELTLKAHEIPYTPFNDGIIVSDCND